MWNTIKKVCIGVWLLLCLVCFGMVAYLPWMILNWAH